MAEEKKEPAKLLHQTQFEEATKKRDDAQKAYDDAKNVADAKLAEAKRIFNQEYKKEKDKEKKAALLQKYKDANAEYKSLAAEAKKLKSSLSKEKRSFSSQEKKFKKAEKTYQARASTVGTDIAAYTEGVVGGLPAVIGAEKEFGPQFTGLNLQTAEQTITGVGDQKGVAGIQAEATKLAAEQLAEARASEIGTMTGQAGQYRGLVSALSPELAASVQQAATQAQQSQGLAALGEQQYAQARQQFAPDVSRTETTLGGLSGIVGTTLGGITPEVGRTVTDINLDSGFAQKMAQEAFARRGRLTGEEMRSAQQAAREAAAASGRLGTGSAIAAEALNRESALAARRAEAAQAANLAFGQQYQGSLAALQAQQAQYGQSAADVERRIGLEGMRYSQLAADQERELNRLNALFGQDQAARATQLQAQNLGFNQFQAQQEGLQALRNEQAARTAQSAQLAAGTYFAPGMQILGGTPTSYTTGSGFTQVGLNAIGSNVPQLISPDAGVNLGMQERSNAAQKAVAEKQADAAKKAGIMSGLGSIAGSAITALAFSDKRMKKDIKKVGKTDSGLPIYTFKYKGENTTQMGVMAQDVEKNKPKAVREIGGLKAVNYAMID